MILCSIILISPNKEHLNFSVWMTLTCSTGFDAIRISVSSILKYWNLFFEYFTYALSTTLVLPSLVWFSIAFHVPNQNTIYTNLVQFLKTKNLQLTSYEELMSIFELIWQQVDIRMQILTRTQSQFH